MLEKISWFILKLARVVVNFLNPRLRGDDGMSKRNVIPSQAGIQEAHQALKITMFFTSNLLSQAQKILRIFEEKKLKIAIAESCTGGLLSALFTEIPGASKVLERGFVTYSNQAKIDLLGVKKKTLENFGAVSAETAEEMARGALKNSETDLAIAITGVAGPEEKSGLVHIAVASHGRPIVNRKFNFSGDRHEVRKASVIAALQLLACKN